MHEKPNVKAMKQIVEAEYADRGDSEVVRAVSVALQGFIASAGNVTLSELKAVESSLSGTYMCAGEAFKEVAELCASRLAEAESAPILQ